MDNEEKKVNGPGMEPAFILDGIYTVDDVVPIFEGLDIEADKEQVRTFLNEMCALTAIKLKSRDPKAEPLPGQIAGCFAASDVLPMFKTAGCEVTGAKAYMVLDCLYCFASPSGWKSSMNYRYYQAAKQEQETKRIQENKPDGHSI